MRDEHHDEYCKKHPDNPSSILPALEDEGEMDSRNSDQEEDISSSTLDPPFVNHTPPTFVTQDVAAGLLLKLKTRHRLSQAAVDEVVQIVSSTISDHMVIEVLTAVQQFGEAHAMDLISPFFQSLPEILKSILWVHLGEQVDSSLTCHKAFLICGQYNKPFRPEECK